METWLKTKPNKGASWRGLWKSFYQPFKPTLFTHPLWCFDANITGETNNISPQGLPVFSSLQWKKHSCVYRRPVPPSGLPRLSPPTPYPLKSTPLCSSFSFLISLKFSFFPGAYLSTPRHALLFPITQNQKPTKQPKNPYAWTSPSSPCPIFLVSFMEKLLKRVIQTCFKWKSLSTNICFLSGTLLLLDALSILLWFLFLFIFFFYLIRCFFPWVLARFILGLFLFSF